MIEWIVIFLIIFCILAWHYSQSADKYNLAQITERQVPMQLTTLWEERNPVVISDIKPRNIWTADSIRKTRFWAAQPIWESYMSSPSETMVVQDRPQQLTWADMLGISQLESDVLLRWFDLSAWIFSVRTEAHIGPEGLRETYGWATAISCTDGEARCILLHSAQKARLPPGWKGLRWADATAEHHPLWSQVQFIEIVLRPNTVLLVPPHWIIAIEPMDSKRPIWWSRSDLHHAVSKLAQGLNEK